MKLLICLSALLVSLGHVRAATWLNDLPTALIKARRENRQVLINFTGSDWCGWCIKLRQEAFSQPQFLEFADKHLVLVEVDFPKRTAQPENVKQANAELARRFGVKGFPTIILVNGQGQEVGRSGYRAGGAEAYVNGLAKIIGISGEPAAKAAPGSVPARFNGARTFPLPVYTNLVLKSVSGTRSSRFALINNQTFAPGDTLRVKMSGGSVQVHCYEIRDDSAVVSVQGENGKRVIKLAKKAK